MTTLKRKSVDEEGQQAFSVSERRQKVKAATANLLFVASELKGRKAKTE